MGIGRMRMLLLQACRWSCIGAFSSHPRPIGTAEAPVFALISRAPAGKTFALPAIA
jgi:hypothetical protein